MIFGVVGATESGADGAIVFDAVLQPRHCACAIFGLARIVAAGCWFDQSIDFVNYMKISM